jgi:hypothetical protein
MKTSTIKIGANAQRHIEKYEGTNEAAYVEFAKRTARKVTISRLDQEICENLRIYAIAHLAFLPTDVGDAVLMSEHEFENHVILTSKNPYELAKVWLKLKADSESYVSVESVLNEYLPPFPKEDFERWGDKNCLSDVSKSWFHSKCMHLDVKVAELNSNTQIGIQVSIEDCIDFVRKFKPNTYKNPVQLQKEVVESRFKEIAGFNLKDYYAEHLIKSCEFRILEPTEIPF